MRELILTMSVSIDCFVAGPRGEIDWVFGDDPEARAWKVATVSDASLHVMGSRTFRDMAAFWPTATGPFAPPMNRIPKAVFSTRGRAVLRSAATTEAPDSASADAGRGRSGPWPPGAAGWGEAEVLDGGDLAGGIARLKAGDGEPIVAHGGAAFARSLVAADLVDRYALLVHPVVLGTGLPIFSDVAPPRRLGLIGSTAFPGGSIARIYRPA